MNTQCQKQLTLQPVAGEFAQPLPADILNIADKRRANVFAWRGQFSPQLVESLLRAYCPAGAHVLDPFTGSGTVLYEASRSGLASQGFELNPAAWILARTYRFMHVALPERMDIHTSLVTHIKHNIPEPPLLEGYNVTPIAEKDFATTIAEIKKSTSADETILLETLVILLDLAKNTLTTRYLYQTLHKLTILLQSLPYSVAPLHIALADARHLPLPNESIDFVLTSPPYINVFNYHQNYRRSAEILGWDLLKIARSEIGSNRANRGNRFLTVIQYCFDIAFVLREIHRVCKISSRIILVIGHESHVLGVPFYNADIIENIARNMACFTIHQRQKRVFKNKFGKNIREDLLHLSCERNTITETEIQAIAQSIALQELNRGLPIVSEKNRADILDAIKNIDTINGTPIFCQ